MRIIFSKKFYNPRAIKSAAAAFARLADFDLLDNKQTITVILKKIDQDVADIIGNEFANYALAKMKTSE
ncbi:MAG: hypothetical protein UU87_C0005G0014 [Parcubacteria group bacterium GW2011_GWA2_42_11]|nr:MAG: hypothetical protein UU87_C0005G0014 [Parcubacteria group bacterium GW2011_GWA2_42_11]